MKLAPAWTCLLVELVWDRFQILTKSYGTTENHPTNRKLNFYWCLKVNPIYYILHFDPQRFWKIVKTQHQKIESLSLSLHHLPTSSPPPTSPLLLWLPLLPPSSPTFPLGTHPLLYESIIKLPEIPKPHTRCRFSFQSPISLSLVSNF